MFLESIELLQAEEALVRIHNLQIGNGLLDKHDADRALRRLKHAAGWNVKPVPATAAALAAIGIEVQRG